ncbi:MAG: CHRD domain-containing protein [Bacteroidota bacterium]
MKFYFLIGCILFCSINYLAAQKYAAELSGPNEAPPNGSPGTGLATITITGNSMRVQCTFSGLVAGVTAVHIHAATMVAFTGTAGVATTTPTFAGFPGGVTSGSYDNTLDMSLASSFNPSYVTAHGGTPTQAWADLKAAMLDGKSYFNIHTSSFPGGEIRGFLITPTCSSTKTGNWNDPSVWSCNIVPTGLENVKILSGHVVSTPASYVAYAKNIEINGELKKGSGSNLILIQ